MTTNEQAIHDILTSQGEHELADFWAAKCETTDSGDAES